MKRKLSALILGAAALAVGFGSLAVAGVVAHKDAIVQTKAATATASLVFSGACGGEGTDDKGGSWTITSDAAESNFDATKGIHYGTSKVSVSNLKLSCSSYNDKTISKIVVNASGASKTSAKLSVTVGGSPFGSEKNLTASATDYTFEGSASGGIVVTLSQSSTKKALYVKSVVVTYDDGAGASYDVAVASNSGTTEVETGGTLALTASTDGDSGDTYTWSSSDTSIATVDSNGVVTGVAAGAVTITATSKTHSGKSGSINITVYEEKTYQLVTSVDDLYVGQEVVIGAIDESAGYALSSTQNKNNRAAVEVSISSGILTATPDVESFILGIEDLSSDTSKTVYSFYDSSENGYIFAASSSSNYLRTETNKSDNSSWTIEIDSASGEATITAQGENTRNTLMGNFGGTNLLFSAYASTSNMTTPMLYVSQDPVTAEQKAETFVARYMHLNGYTESTNACAGDDGYYLTAKAALIAMGADVISTLQSSSNPTISAGYARYQAWALACHDSTPFAGEGIVKAQNSLFDFDTKESTNAVLISTLGAAAVVAAAGFIFLKKKRA